MSILKNPNEYTIGIDLIDSVQGSSQDGAELNCWDEVYFFEHHFPQQKIRLPTQAARRNSAINLIKFFSGQNTIYEDLLIDIRNVILSMRCPTNKSALLFKEFVDQTASSEAAGTVTQIVDADIVIGRDYLIQAPEVTVSGVDGLAGDIRVENVQPATSQRRTITTEIISDCWRKLAAILCVESQQTPSALMAMAETAIGMVSMHCFKLMSKNVQSVANSMLNNMNKHFLDLYKASELGIALCPPHIKSLEMLQPLFVSGDDQLFTILSLMIGKSIIEVSKPTSQPQIRGVLYGACLTHLGMHGLTPVKQIEQTSLALGVSISAFCRAIFTTQVKDSVINVCQMLNVSREAPGKIKIMGVEYDLKSQMSWRFSRLYNNAHFNRFATKKNARLIIRCAAYLSEVQEESSILSMTIIGTSINRKLFDRERKIAAVYVKDIVNSSDKGLAPDSRKYYNNVVPETPGAFSDDEGDQ